MDVLITSSPKTLKWLDIIKSNIIKAIPSIEYNESTNWAFFKNPATKRNVVYLQPFKNQIRLFTELTSSFDTELESTPASGNWAKMYPSVFKIRSEHEVEKAIYLIINSYRFDSTKKSLAKS